MKEKMYVRCPVDAESLTDPRVFVIGQTSFIDDFANTVVVNIRDPFNYHIYYDMLPVGEMEFPMKSVCHADLFTDTLVMYKGKKHSVIASKKNKNDYTMYYLQNEETREVIKALECDIIAPFNIGRVSPDTQLKNYEFQNPVWYLGRTIVNKNVHILENSIYGFKELAGCKIFLLPHQINTIMRCIQAEPCRYMLADEVGMGKTIEAISILKIYLMNKSNRNILIMVPSTLAEQWKTELLFKFDICVGALSNGNRIELKAIEKMSMDEVGADWDFIIVDEVHKYLHDKSVYSDILNLSKSVDNILLLSATPIQQITDEYLNLLRILDPSRYDNISNDEFTSMLKKRDAVVKKAVLVKDDLDDYEEIINECIENDENIAENEEARDLYDEMMDYYAQFSTDLNDSAFSELVKKVSITSPRGGIYDIKVLLSYICNNYQIENHMIRNRRDVLENKDDEEKIMPSRKLIELSYEVYSEYNLYERNAMDLLSNWINNANKNEEMIREFIQPLLSTFFSSSHAFVKCIENLSSFYTFPEELIEAASDWKLFDDDILNKINDILDDPDGFSDYYSSRPLKVMDYLYENLYESKTVLFTDYSETFKYYKDLLLNVFGKEQVAFFCKDMDSDNLEVNSYRFQNDDQCYFMLCDSTGGEGRNFQCADYVVHIDLPWNADAIEQRIGRLDRLERDKKRSSEVYSVVVHSENTFEDSLFKFWNEGLDIFNKSLSGMEIIINDVNKEIYSSFIDTDDDDFRYSLSNKIQEINTKLEDVRTKLKREQILDVTAALYNPMNVELKKIIEDYNENENELFSDAMLRWASLAGFHGYVDEDNNIVFSPGSFSVKSAENSMLIPPDWSLYSNDKQIELSNRIREMVGKKKKEITYDIRGTFIREKAISNDYLHFYAPGDPIFDCIVDNAIHSCKGQSAAFAVKSNIEWTGFIYTWSVKPDIAYLMDNGLQLYSINPYKNYVSNKLIVTPISVENYNAISEEKIIKEYNRICEYAEKADIDHLGRRGKSFGIMNIGFEDVSNIEWFRAEYPEEKWIEMVTRSRKEASVKAKEIYKRNSSTKKCKEEMERILSSHEASADYYGVDNNCLKERQEMEIVLEALKKPKLKLESASFIMMKRG